MEPAIATFLGSLPGNEHPPILVGSDNALSAVTSRHDMVHRALKLDSDLSRHPFHTLIYRQSVRIC
jgi:hypothetical protein